MLTVTLGGLTARSGYEQYVDSTGTAWILTALTGWSAAPARRTAHTERATSDGAHRSAAYRETRSIEVAGRFFPPTLEVGWAQADVVTGLCPDPGEVYPLTVQDPNRALTSYVEQGGELLCEPVTPLLWDWSVQLVAADPYRYAQSWVSVGPAMAGLGSSGGIGTSGSGIATASPGILTGTAPSYAQATVTGSGTAESLLVFEVVGPTTTVAVTDLFGASEVGVRGAVAAGSSLFVNTTGRPAYDVPRAGVPIPAYGAVYGGVTARGAITVFGGWPRLGPGVTRTFRMTGQAGAGSALTVHTRGAWT